MDAHHRTSEGRSHECRQVTEEYLTELEREGEWMRGCGKFGIVSYPGGYGSESERKDDYPVREAKMIILKAGLVLSLRREGREPSSGESLEFRFH
ncbi:hypothetical protein CEXT_114351 [Caerostris extrusa]|uniref:Uncharacterized protein n=1 Tax=Caerostris extrusa TaxID=172846 RepID=A0AAV4YC11_CAEEX|nr:hypothetical protein CEXT_114351 [Caerostris extrusa]